MKTLTQIFITLFSESERERKKEKKAKLELINLTIKKTMYRFR